MKVVNIVKVKEEFDYESLCRKLEYQVDFLTSEIERQQKLRDMEKVQMEEKVKECEMSLTEAKKNLSVKSEVISLSIYLLSRRPAFFVAFLRGSALYTIVIIMFSFIRISV